MEKSFCHFVYLTTQQTNQPTTWGEFSPVLFFKWLFFCACASVIGHWPCLFFQCLTAWTLHFLRRWIKFKRVRLLKNVTKPWHSVPVGCTSSGCFWKEEHILCLRPLILSKQSFVAAQDWKSPCTTQANSALVGPQSTRKYDTINNHKIKSMISFYCWLKSKLQVDISRFPLILASYVLIP